MDPFVVSLPTSLHLPVWVFQLYCDSATIIPHTSLLYRHMCKTRSAHLSSNRMNQRPILAQPNPAQPSHPITASPCDSAVYALYSHFLSYNISPSRPIWQIIILSSFKTHTCMHISTYTCLHVYVFICLDICIFMCVYVYIYIVCMYVHMLAYIYIHN